MESEKKTRKLRILFNTNAPWVPSGYAQQARLILPRMAQEGFPTACIVFYGLEGVIINLDGVFFYPRMGSPWGDDAIIHHSKHFNADIVFTLQDIWTLAPETFKTLEVSGKRLIPIVPVDHEPIPPAIFDRLRMAYRIVTYSPFGYRELKGKGMHSTYIPHAVDTNQFRRCDRAKIRERLKIPNDVFLYGMVAANKDMPPRKGFQHALDAFKMVHDKYPKTGLYFHTRLGLQGGFPIEQYAKNLGISDAIYAVDEYEHMYHIQPEDMGQVYNAMDVYLMPSLNEGFGIPLIEAQACEIPVIATDFTAMRDLLIDGKTGFKLKVVSTKFTPLLSYVADPDTNHLTELMIKLYEMSPRERGEMGKNGRKFVQENFEFDTVWREKWLPFLDILEKECYPTS